MYILNEVLPIEVLLSDYNSLNVALFLLNALFIK